MLSDLQRWWPLLLAGAAGMLLGWIGRIRSHATSWIERNCTATLVVDPEVSNTYSSDIDQMLAWLDTIPELHGSRRRVMGPAVGYNFPGVQTSCRRTALAPGLYWTRILGKRCLLDYRVRSRDQSSQAHRTIYIRAFTRERDFADRIVAAIAAYQESHTKGFIHIDSVSATRTVGTYIALRPAASVVTDGDVVERIVEAIRQFRSQREEYSRRHLPRRLMILLEGPPGNGKTSAVHAVASELGMGLAAFNLNGMSDSILQGQWTYATDRKILLLEDVDAMGVDLGPRADVAVRPEGPVAISAMPLGDKRGSSRVGVAETRAEAPAQKPALAPASPAKDQVSLSTLLNLLDGLASAPEQVVIMTTNHASKLDPALLRDERTHMRVHLGPPSWDAAQRLWDRFNPDGAAAPWEEIRRRLHALPTAQGHGPGVTASTLQRMYKAATLGGEGADAIGRDDGPRALSA